MEKRKKAAYYASGCAGALLLAGTMGAAALALLPYLAGGAVLPAWIAPLHTAGGAAIVWCAAMGAAALFILQARLRPEEPEQTEELAPKPVRRRPAHEKVPRHAKTKVTL